MPEIETFAQHGLVGLLVGVLVVFGGSVLFFVKHLITLFMQQIKESEERNREVINNNTKAMTDFSNKAAEILRKID